MPGTSKLDRYLELIKALVPVLLALCVVGLIALGWFTYHLYFIRDRSTEIHSVYDLYTFNNVARGILILLAATAVVYFFRRRK